MLPRQRVSAALQFSEPDLVPVEYHASPAGFMQHGERLRELWREAPDDFGPPGRFAIPEADPGPRTWRDAWGVQWHEEAFGAGGIAIGRPLADWQALASMRTPPLPRSSGSEFEIERARAARHRESYFLKTGWISLFELMHALRPFEDVLMDIASDRPEIHALADRLVEHHLAWLDYVLARGVDAIQFGDDYGSQAGLMLSPAMWRRFFRPRYEILVNKVKAAGAVVFFHSCGKMQKLLEDIAGLGVAAIWPQLNLYDLPWLARFCRTAGVAIALHPDRGELMIRSKPEAVRRYVLGLAETFEVDRGGSWFYVEIDRGFPFDNVAALTAAIAELRSGRHAARA